MLRVPASEVGGTPQPIVTLLALQVATASLRKRSKRISTCWVHSEEIVDVNFNLAVQPVASLESFRRSFGVAQNTWKFVCTLTASGPSREALG